jgi:CheY-like chemotaxis protein
MATSSSKGTILVVEDDFFSRAGLTNLLESSGFRVIAATDGVQALRTIQAGVLPDLILLDMLLPILDGWRFLDNVRANPTWNAIPIIVMTGIVLSPEWARDHGCSGFLKKPIDPENLFEQIEQCLRVGAGAHTRRGLLRTSPMPR